MRLSPSDIVFAVAKIERVRPSEIFSPSRKAPHARARQLAMYLCRESGMSLKRTGRFFHRRHSTVVHAYGLVAALVSGDAEYRLKVESVRQAARVSTREAA
jgi:chromosomal replication initiation ATPase DnaA